MDESKNVTEKNTKATERQIQSVQRAINILNCFTMTNSALMLGQISNQLNLNKGTVHGILSTLYQNEKIQAGTEGTANEYALPEWIYQPEWKWAVHAGGGAV